MGLADLVCLGVVRPIEFGVSACNEARLSAEGF